LVNQPEAEKHSGNTIITVGADPAYAIVATIRSAPWPAATPTLSTARRWKH